MNKVVNYYLLIIIFMSSFGGVVHAGMAMGDIIMPINMSIADVTCQVNSGNGLDQQINMPPVFVGDLQNDKGESMEAPLKVDCTGSQSQPNSIVVSVKPGGSSSLIGAGDNGVLKTDKSGVGLKLTWKYDGRPVSLISENPRTFLPSMAMNHIWDLGIIAEVIKIPGEDIKSGRYNGTIKINMRYI